MIINADPSWFASQVILLGWIPLVMMGASLLGSYLSGKQGQKSKSTSTTTRSFQPEFQGIANTIGPMIQHRLNNQFKLPESFATQGIKQINNTFDLAGQDLDNRLTARGLGSSPIAGAAQARHVGNRAGAITNFQGTLPMVQRQFQNEDLAMALQALGLGGGQTTNQTGQQGGGVGGGLSSLGSMIGFMYGQGMFSGGQGGGVPNGMQNYNPMRGGMFE